MWEEGDGAEAAVGIIVCVGSDPRESQSQVKTDEMMNKGDVQVAMEKAQHVVERAREKKYEAVYYLEEKKDYTADYLRELGENNDTAKEKASEMVQ